MNFRCSVYLVFFLVMALQAEDKPLMHFCFSEISPDGTVANRTGGGYEALISGGYEKRPHGVLFLDGADSRILIRNSGGFDISRNATFAMIFRKSSLPGNPDGKKNLMFFCKPGSFVLAKTDRHLYGNANDGKNWNCSLQLQNAFDPADDAYHHLAVTLEYFSNINESEEWFEITYYLDGKEVKRKRFKDKHFGLSNAPIEIGAGNILGRDWNLRGEIADVRIYDRLLSGNEIKKIVLSQKLAAPAFSQGIQLSKAEHSFINGLKISPARRSALTNYAMSGADGGVTWKQIAAAPEKYLREIRKEESSIVFMDTGVFAHLFSWYDRKAQREMLVSRCDWVSWSFQKNGKIITLTPFHSGVKSRLSFDEATGEIVLQYSHDQDSAYPVSFTAESRIHFTGKRIAYTHKTECLTAETILYSAEFPKVSLCTLDPDTEKQLVPNGPGIVEEKPAARGLRYSQPYPRAFASMQFTAFYDKSGGVLISPADPLGRIKEINTEGSNDTLNASFSWRVPYDKPDTPNRFDPECRAVLELFRGDWYDAALIYRKLQEEIRSIWWTRELNIPDFFRNNCWWIHESFFGFYEMDFIELKEYIGLDCFRVDVWSWWEKTVAISCPSLRANPEWIEYVRFMRNHGIRLIPYTNGRIWSEKDRRGEDYQYSRYGKPNTVLSDGKRISEYYNIKCDVICPFTEVYQKFYTDKFIRLSMQGLDGIYIDQLGAAYQPPCYDPAHGHRYADWDAWNRNGYAKMIGNVRKCWRKHGEEKILTTEDNVEIMIGLIDGMQCYRWAFDGQVPVYPMVYAGKMQIYNRRAATLEAKFQTVAEQLVNGEQIGAFTKRELCFPFNTQFRHYAKKIIWLRHALLPFFNEGGMMRPPQFLHPVQQLNRFWGMFGTGHVTKPAVQSAAWEKEKILVAVLINTEGDIQRNSAIFGEAAEDSEMEIFSADGTIHRKSVHVGKIRYDFELSPRSFQIIFVYPRGKRPAELFAGIEKDFRTIAAVDGEKDPYLHQRLCKAMVRDPRIPMNLVDSPLVSGARPNKEGGFIDYNYLTFIDAGEFDFSVHPPKQLVLEISTPHSFGGIVNVYNGEIVPENKIAEVFIPKGFKTPDGKTFLQITAPLIKNLTGKHRIVFNADGFFPYSIRSWHVKD